jgi:Leucine-rich repeat (LRR) protein
MVYPEQGSLAGGHGLRIGGMKCSILGPGFWSSMVEVSRTTSRSNVPLGRTPILRIDCRPDRQLNCDAIFTDPVFYFMLPNLSSSALRSVTGAGQPIQPDLALPVMLAAERLGRPLGAGAGESLRGRVHGAAAQESFSALPAELWKHHIAPFLGEDVRSLQSVALTSREGLSRLACQTLEQKWRALSSSAVLAPWLAAERAQDPHANKLVLMARVMAAVDACVASERLPVADLSTEEKARWCADAQFVALFGPIVEEVTGQRIEFGRPDRCRQEAALLRAMLPDLARDLEALEELSILVPLSCLPPEIGMLTGLRTLILARNRLRWLPTEFDRLQALEILDLQGNQFAGLPPAVCRLARLQQLDLSGNQLREVTDHIELLQGLTWLDVAQNQLTSLPAALGRCGRLRLLDVRHNRIQALPDALCELPLERLVASNNRLVTLPAGLGRLRRLEALRLSGNPLTHLPLSMGDLISLKELDLSHTRVADLPAGCDRLQGLWCLEMRSCNLERLPDGVEQMPSLELLDLSDNQLSDVPMQLSRGPKLQYLRLGNNRITTFRFQPGDFAQLKNLSLRQNTIQLAEGAEHLPALEMLEYETPLAPVLVLQAEPERAAALPPRRAGRARRRPTR